MSVLTLINSQTNRPVEEDAQNRYLVDLDGKVYKSPAFFFLNTLPEPHIRLNLQKSSHTFLNDPLMLDLRELLKGKKCSNPNDAIIGRDHFMAIYHLGPSNLAGPILAKLQELNHRYFTWQGSEMQSGGTMEMRVFFEGKKEVLEWLKGENV